MVVVLVMTLRKSVFVKGLERQQDAPVDIDGLQIMFQGGFVGKDCTVLGSQDGTTFPVDLHRPFFPQDNNTLQISPFPSFHALCLMMMWWWWGRASVCRYHTSLLPLTRPVRAIPTHSPCPAVCRGSRSCALSLGGPPTSMDE